MTEEGAGFTRISARDIQVGKPLPWSLYDANRKLLLRRGHVIETERQCELLIKSGLFRNSQGRDSDGIRRPAPVQQEEEDKGPSTKIFTLEEARMRVGDAIQLQGSADSPRYYVKLIGYLKNRGMIVTAPEADGELVVLREGQTFIARFFSGQNAYAFTVTVVKQTHVPFSHLHLSYPREIRGLEIRKASRVGASLPASVTVGKDAGQAPVPGKMVDLSVGGAALRSKAAIGNKGDTVRIQFKLDIDGIDSLLTFESVIRSCGRDEADAAVPYLYGVQFVNMDSTMTLALAAYVYKRLVDEDKS